MNAPMYFEIFEEFEKATDNTKRLAVLKKYGTHQFKEILNYAFNPNIKFDISGIPVYRPSVNPAGLNETYLHHEFRRLYLFLPVHAKYRAKLPVQKEQNILHTILSNLHAKEAKLLEQILTKTLKIKNLTPELVCEAFPDMPWRPEPKPEKVKRVTKKSLQETAK